MSCPVGRQNVQRLSLSWIGNGATFGEDLVYKSSPTVVDGVVYFGTDAGQLFAFPASCRGSQCDPTWRKQLVQAIYNTPAVVDGVLYVGTASPEGGGGGVDGAIHLAGGPAILADCVARFPDGLQTGQAGWTTAGNLAGTWVVHVVGPNYLAGQRDRALLTSCYRNALALADELRAASMAFPLVSAGVYGWPLDDAAQAGVDTLRVTHTDVQLCRVVAFGRASYDALERAMRAT